MNTSSSPADIAATILRVVLSSFSGETWQALPEAWLRVSLAEVPEAVLGAVLGAMVAAGLLVPTTVRHGATARPALQLTGHGEAMRRAIAVREPVVQLMACAA